MTSGDGRDLLIRSPFFTGNLLKTQNKLAFLDFGMMADIDEEDRYGLFGLVIGLQNKDLPLVTENLLKVGYRKAYSVKIKLNRFSHHFLLFAAWLSKRYYSS